MNIFSWVWWRQRPKKWLAYVVLVAVGWLGFFFFRVINWTRVEGKDKFRLARNRHNGHERRNVIIVSNHLTMFDSFIIGIIAYFPELIFYPSAAPYHFAAQENYFTNVFVKLMLYCLKALPVKPGRKDLDIMRKIINLLPEANLHIFPGGRRSHDPLGADPDNPIRAGVGYIVANAPDPKPLLIPVYLGGSDKLFGGKPGQSGKSRWFPRLGAVLRRPLVRFGDPIPWQDIIQKHGNRKVAWQAITKRIADSINELNPAHDTE